MGKKNIYGVFLQTTSCKDSQCFWGMKLEPSTCGKIKRQGKFVQAPTLQKEEQEEKVRLSTDFYSSSWSRLDIQQGILWKRGKPNTGQFLEFLD